jgi:hypothetical protein
MSSADEAVTIDGTGERAGKWAVLAIVAIGVFMTSWPH